jgi:hypothetical protein
MKDINQMAKDYNQWGEENGFFGEDLKSADEMVLTYPNMTAEQLTYISDFIEAWNIAADQEFKCTPIK